jgi:hypothetical protein
LTIGMADHVPTDLAVNRQMSPSDGCRGFPPVGWTLKHAIGSVTGSFAFQETSIHVVSPARHAAAIGTVNR